MIRRPPRPTLFPYPPLFRSPPPSPAAPPSQGVRLNAQRILHLQDLDRRVPGVRHADVHARRSGGAVARPLATPDRKSTRLNSSHLVISYAVFCLKKKKKHHNAMHVR